MIPITKEILNSYVERGLVLANRHQSLPLTIYNYSRTCQYDSVWDEVTLQCRGLIMDDAGEIVARGFNKFFNYEESASSGKIPIKGDYVYVQEKMDGSLGILFYYADEWHMATRGSFHSDQAVEGLKILKEKYNNLLAFERSVSYLCEIIYPKNRIVVDYGSKPRIVFLSVISRGVELHWTTACSFFSASGIRKSDIVKTEQHFKFSPELYESLKAKNIRNAEGFVLRFQPDSFRMKIKFEEYVRLHRLLTNFSNVDIWEHLSRGEELDQFLEMVPDEFDRWVKAWEKALKFSHVMWMKHSQNYLDQLAKEEFTCRKEEALWIQARVTQPYWSILFSMLNGRDPGALIWKQIKPNYQKPFWNTEE
jgi:RNA ligase